MALYSAYCMPRAYISVLVSAGYP